MRASFPSHLRGIFIYMATIVAAHGQADTTSSQDSLSPQQLTLQISPTLQAFQQEQQVLAQSLITLAAQGATAQQWQAWQQQNATSLAYQQQLALDLAADAELEPQPLIAQVNIPANASQTLVDLLTMQAAMANARALIHNQLLNALPGAEISDAQIAQMEQNEVQLFQQEVGANAQLQAQRALTLANESIQQPVPLPPPLVLPPGASPQLAAFLNAKDLLMRNRVVYSNQYLTAAPAVREAAMQQWEQQNSARLQQLQALAQNLSATTSATQN